MIINEVEKMIKLEWAEIENSAHLLTFLKIYSQLYLNGTAPPLCAKCHKEMFLQLKKNGIEKATQKMNTLSKINKYKKKGIVYFTALAMHVNLQNMSDEMALSLIEKNFLKKEDFEILPEEKTIENNITNGKYNKNNKKRK